MDKLKVKKSNNLSIVLSLLLNVFFYVIAVLLTLFIVSFDWNVLFPRWELFVPLPPELQGSWPWQKGVVEIVSKGTPGAYFQPGVLIVSAVVQSLGFMLFKNTQWGRKLKLTLEKVFQKNTRIIAEFNYLISDQEFGKKLYSIDQHNKKETWLLIIQTKLQKYLDHIPKKVESELYADEMLKSNRTKKWIKKRESLELRLTNEWINNNLHLIRIRYPRINTRMVISGVEDIKTRRMAITDVKAIERKETTQKIITTLIFFTITSILTALAFPAFRQDIWMFLKDFLVHTASLITNIILGIMSAALIHEARIRETEDRKGYIRDYVGEERYQEAERKIISRMTAEEIDYLENQLFKTKKISLEELDQMRKESEPKTNEQKGS